jgi:sporulation protein YlmC with PRC-barrel domain
VFEAVNCWLADIANSRPDGIGAAVGERGTTFAAVKGSCPIKADVARSEKRHVHIRENVVMKRIPVKPLAATALLLVTLASYGNAYAQGAPQAITEKRTDVVQLASGYRASKLSGADVYNRNKDTIGTLDDLIVSPAADRGTYAILSVGGFLGMGKHLVAVPFNDLQINNRRVVLPDATKKSLEALPEFKYAPD